MGFVTLIGMASVVENVVWMSGCWGVRWARRYSEAVVGVESWEDKVVGMWVRNGDIV